MESWTLVGVVLIAVLVGAALPVLFEAYRTLRAARRAIARLEDRVDDTLADVRTTARHANRIGETLAPHLGEVAGLMEALAGLSRPVRDLRANLVTLATWVATLAPAVAAAARSFSDRGERPGATEDEEQDPARRAPVRETVTSDGRSPS